MNDDQPSVSLDELKSQHRRLDQQIAHLAQHGAADQLELARLKKRKLRIKDQIQHISNSSIPDIIA